MQNKKNKKIPRCFKKYFKAFLTWAFSYFLLQLTLKRNKLWIIRYKPQLPTPCKWLNAFWGVGIKKNNKKVLSVSLSFLVSHGMKNFEENFKKQFGGFLIHLIFEAKLYLYSENKNLKKQFCYCILNFNSDISSRIL